MKRDRLPSSRTGHHREFPPRLKGMPRRVRPSTLPWNSGLSRIRGRSIQRNRFRGSPGAPLLRTGISGCAGTGCLRDLMTDGIGDASGRGRSARIRRKPSSRRDLDRSCRFLLTILLRHLLSPFCTLPVALKKATLPDPFALIPEWARLHSGVAQDLHPKAFPLSPAMLPLPASQRNPVGGPKASFSRPFLPSAISSRSNSSSIR
jgi:hypothetical protein